ncbi:MAG: tetratricopeptide repeat protein [Thermoanaerobacteraceae bacterium]|nr:tetratricopeptide repeat protein [Thermoanaerobacteraceae bacterium]
MKKGISLCMIVKNEEENLPRCLNSIKNYVDEIIIVDTGSDDRTVEIARSLGASVYYFSWNGSFSDARNFSMDKATREWILIMDADDEMDSNDAMELRTLIRSRVDVYLSKTISRTESDDIIGLNPRLIKNRNGYRYSGKIHEQIINNVKHVNNNAVIKTADVKIYHYGYLKSEVEKKAKRERNILIIGEELKENPENPFMLFNLGNEYFAMGEFEDALIHYLKSFQYANGITGYTTRLYVRVVLCLIELKRYDEAITFIEQGLKDFPTFTDLYFLRGHIHHLKKEYTLAIKDFNTCIDMGEPDINIAFVYGVGGYKAYNALGDIYFELNDMDEAIRCYINALKLKPDHLDMVYKIGGILLKNYNIDYACNRLEDFFKKCTDKDRMILADIMYLNGYYDRALAYIENISNMTKEVYILKIMCLYRKKCFSELVSEMKDCRQQDDRILQIKIWSRLAIGAMDDIEKDVDGLNNYTMKRTLISLMKILKGEDCEVLSEDERESRLYTDCIFEVLDNLLFTGSLEIFEKALVLLNKVNDHFVLLRLGKLYYKYGYYKMAEDEILRSLKLFNVYDEESMAILNNVGRTNQ